MKWVWRLLGGLGVLLMFLVLNGAMAQFGAVFYMNASPFINFGAGIGTVFLWKFLAEENKAKAMPSGLKGPEGEPIDKLLELPTQKIKRGALPKLITPIVNRDALRDSIAEEIAAVYGNDVNDMYREHADRVMPVLDAYVETLNGNHVVDDPDFLRILTEQRNRALVAYGKSVEDSYTATADKIWREGVKPMNEEIEKVLRARRNA